MTTESIAIQFARRSLFREIGSYELDRQETGTSTVRIHLFRHMHKTTQFRARAFEVVLMDSGSADPATTRSMVLEYALGREGLILFSARNKEEALAHVVHTILHDPAFDAREDNKSHNMHYSQ